MAENRSDNQSNRINKKRPTNSLEKHIRLPRQPRKPEKGDNILYISTKTNIKAQLSRCNKLIHNNESEIIIYCMGAAIQRGILLALQLCEEHTTYKISTNTITTELLDDLEPSVDEADYEIQKRFNSALRIRIFNCHPIKSTSS
ncbi:ribonuclease P protein subunit p20 [Diorhabda carinulata]|uniref:ribonuclease P protein subunit p20 n=1 Tax=Diorhabda carinulata TaxID=1163345 RepID=UPI0025A13587|nr:ribonuclease P protein subunit p20 [Diorhabda carinulata]